MIYWVTVSVFALGAVFGFLAGVMVIGYLNGGGKTE